jgi:histidine phosphotransferase ChpT
MHDDGELGENDNGPALAQPSKADLAAALAARVCHDLINPAGAISTGVDLLEDADKPEMRDDAIGLIVESSKKLGLLLPFYRVAFGASAAADTFDVRKLEEMARGIYSFQRAELFWDVPYESLGKAAARALLNLAQLGYLALPRGGTARVMARREGGELILSVRGEGPKISLKPEVIEGLNGQPMSEGLGGYWVQAYYLQSLLGDVGGTITQAASETSVEITARLRA